MNAHFLSTLQWYTMLTGSNWISQLSQGSSTPGKNSISVTAKQCSACILGQSWICTFWAHCSSVL